MKTALSIAGFDPSSGAGVTADLAVFAAHGLFGTSCVTALTVQSTLGVRASYPVDADVVLQTLNCLAEDVRPDGIKIGMLATAGAVASVVRFVHAQRAANARLVVVLDPVLRSSSGHELLTPLGVDLMREELLPLVDWCTPNLDELAQLTGRMTYMPEHRLAASTYFRRMYPTMNLVVTGGHQDPPDDLVMSLNDDTTWLPGTRIESRATHGTGCAYSSALLCGLVQGLGGVDAARAAKRYVAEGILRAQAIGRGKGPLNLLWPVREMAEPVRG
ncbi:hydroxymethylpyrimidine/phosphomethylpyrimidine kinase [Granulicella rosea]|uniref:hydroxymethylpyrimidine kinase n=1 Tax=Granulicella rosea TaxID=474952 RepID=A0A239J9Z5_9BACT|nr:hydroxymethylpyrimidine/phosphomethylpyrimidine kinase [Granulicella rosea]SNT02707.1 hydroxymethylpyrimidine/phosphomethylpyrimidine kinase [Granulicella rosea]